MSACNMLDLDEGITHTNQFTWVSPVEETFDGLGPFQVWRTECRTYRVCRCDGIDRRFVAIRERTGNFFEKIIGNDLVSLYDAFLAVEKDFYERNGIAMESNVLEIMREAKEQGLHKLKREDKEKKLTDAFLASADIEADTPIAVMEKQEANGEALETKEKKRRGRKGIGINGMSGLDACVQILSVSDKPLSNIEILAKLTEQGLWSSKGKSPAAVIKAIIMSDIKKGDKAKLKKVSKGFYSINK